MRFIPHDIGTYLVRSRTREGHHIIDVLELTCSCEGFEHYDTCWHLRRYLLARTNLRTIIRMRARNPETCLPV